MNRWKTASLALAALCVAEAVRVALPDARAQDPESTEAATATTTASPRLACRVFLVDVSLGYDLETSDRTTEIGQWVGEQEDAGWLLYGVDFEVGQKATGYPQGYVQVCTYPK